MIKKGGHFRINSDEKYEPFKNVVGVKDEGVKYGIKSIVQKGWRYLEF